MFGGRLATRLAQDEGLKVIAAGRDVVKASAFAAGTRLRPVELDVHAADFSDRVAALNPDVIVDAVGPFQDYDEVPYRVAQIAIQIGAHYLDLSDDAAFTSGIADLNEAAIAAGVTVLSGASSVPAVSSVVAHHLIRDMTEVHCIESVILPGNRAPRGKSVMRAILSQVGRPLRLWQANRFVDRPAWSDLKKYDLEIAGTLPVSNRHASLIGAPDLSLFPDAMNAQSVAFRAGLELSIMQYGLWMLHWLPRIKLVRSVSFLMPVLKWIADRLEPLGSDRGGMQVSVVGQTGQGLSVRRTWTLIVEQGDGPYIPGVPAQILIQNLFAGKLVPGARPCLGAFTMTDLKSGFDGLKITTGQKQEPMDTVFGAVLGDVYTNLPAPLQDLHRVLHRRRWQGVASIQRGTGFLSRCAGWLAGFPSASDSVPVEVEMTRTGNGETWVRQFGSKRFRSFLSASKRDDKTFLQERFGWMAFLIDLSRDQDGLQFPVISGRVLGIPLPGFMRPKSETREYVDAQECACFDVRISMPMTGLIAHYRGQLAPVDANA